MLLVSQLSEQLSNLGRGAYDTTGVPRAVLPALSECSSVGQRSLPRQSSTDSK